ncbi:cytochrome P450 [Mycena maculata]|uniref:Cytochrome P450 n=1 Tax=Mycena maculata TaxID=230809 RepID=A0AAD7N565_9AGAR|nr:cytochrome P450 [Mycena maculata]
MSIFFALGWAALFAVVWLRKVGSREDGLPPGPPTVPLLGNLHMFPTESIYYKLTTWARKYGGIYSLKLGPGTVIVLTDVAAVKELMERRGPNTADRPAMLVNDIVTGGLNMVFMHYGGTWRTFRRTAHAILTHQAAARHLPIQQAEATQLLHDILDHPESFYTHIQRFTYSVVVSVLYGNRAPRYETPETVAFYDYECQFEHILEPGATPPVDMLPIFNLVPERWAKWKRDCRRVRNLQRAVYFGLLDETGGRLRSGSANGSYLEEVLGRQEEFGMDREMIGYLGGILVEAGAATTYSYLHTLVLCLVAYPDAQKKAHEEIDRVVGEHRMPTLDDLEQMPFIRGLILEAHRFRPVVPLLVPRGTLAPVEYKGYTIPKGATIFVNAWGIFHDPALYDDPENFVPDRYLLNENGTKPGSNCPDLKPDFIFGLGRRSCPGIHLAHNSININAMYFLWAFNFNMDIDAAGNPIKLDTSAYLNGLATGPRPFKCRITPRSAEKAEIIRREFLGAADTFSKFEFGLSAEDKEYVAKSRARAG